MVAITFLRPRVVLSEGNSEESGMIFCEKQTYLVDIELIHHTGLSFVRMDVAPNLSKSLGVDVITLTRRS